ncbi:TPA: phage tail fiber protein [Klebsiella pneumoniae]
MTVSTQVSRNEYTGNGATTQYDFTFRILDKSHLLVQTLDTSESIVTLTLGTDYTVTGVNRYNGGKVVLTSALPAGYKISIERSTPVTQEASIRNQGGFFPEIHEDAFDKLTMLVQQAYGWWSGLSLRKPSWLANYYDALNNRIRNLRDPSQAQDAATKNYVDGQIVDNTNAWKAGDAIIDQKIDSNFRRTIRVPEADVEMVASIEGRRNSLFGWNSSGKPVPIFTMTDTADLALKLASEADYLGAGLSGYEIGSKYLNKTVGKKLNLFLSPWDFGAIADGTLHPLSERYASLALAQVDYPFVTSLTQSIDYAAIQKCVNEMVTRGAAGMTMGGRGRFCVNDVVQVNKTGSVNEANKYIDFSGAEICSFGGTVILNDTSFSWWALQNGVSLSDSKLVFAGTTAAQARATITVTGLTVGKSYAVSLVTEEYTSSGYLRIRLDGAAISNANEYGPGVRYAEFVATATAHEIELQDDTYNTTPTACTVKEVDVRELFYPIRFYQTGSSITHGSMIVNNLRVVNKNSAAFGSIRCEDLNHARFTGVTGIDGFYGPALHMLNLTIWSENNTIEYLKSANNREAVRFNRAFKNGVATGLNSFARTQIDRIIISGNRYAVVCGVACSVYDSVIGTISGNLTANFRAIFSLHGDQTGTLAKGIRVENNSAPGSAGIFEYGRNDLRRLFLADVGYYTGVKLLADGSLDAGTTSNENEMSNRDFRPAVPRFNTLVFLEKSGGLGAGLSYNAGTYMWSELLLNCTPGTAYNIGTSKGLTVNHGVVEIDAALRLDDGSAYQGTAYSIKMLKGTVTAADAQKVIAYQNSHVISSESLATTWSGNSVPSITLTAGVPRSIQIFARWTV